MFSTNKVIRVLATARIATQSSSRINSTKFFSILSTSSPSETSRLSTSTSSLSSSSNKFNKVQSSTYATSTTEPSTTYDPRETAAQEFLDTGNQALEADDLTSAGRAYGESLRIKDTAIGNYNLGVVRYTEKNLPMAIKHFLHSLTLTPTSTTPRKSLSESNDPTPPLTPTEIILADTHTNLGACFIMSEPPRPDLALYHLQEALEINPDDGEVCFNLAAVLEATGEEDEALVAYNRAESLGVEAAKVNIRNVSACPFFPVSFRTILPFHNY